MSERSRIYSTRRSSVVKSIVELLRTINGTDEFNSNLYEQVFDKLKYIEDLNDFPAVCVTAGSETRTYQSNEYKDRYLNCKIVIFVNEENPLTKLDAVIEDIETLLEENGRLAYIDKKGNTQYTHDITLINISTDEGTLEPMAIGEMSILVHY